MGRDVTARIRSVDDARELARRRLPKGIFQYYDRGSGSDVTTRANLAAFEQVLFRPHVARWFPERDLRTTICGHDLDACRALLVWAARDWAPRRGVRGRPRCGRGEHADVRGAAPPRRRSRRSWPWPGPDLLPALLPWRPRGVRGDRRAGHARRRLGARPDRRLGCAFARPPAAAVLGARARAGGDGVTGGDTLRAAGAQAASLAGTFCATASRSRRSRWPLNEKGKAMHRFDGGIKAMYKETPRWKLFRGCGSSGRGR